MAGRRAAPRALQRPLLGDLAALRLPGERPSGRRRPAAARACAVAQLAAGRGRDERGGRRGCWASTTSPPTARSARARPPSGRCSELRWERRADGVLEAHGARPTRSATTWCVRWSARCSSSATGTGRRTGRARCWRRRVRDSAVHVVRPHGLTLEEVGYPADGELAARNLAARNRRSLPVTGASSDAARPRPALRAGCCLTRASRPRALAAPVTSQVKHPRRPPPAPCRVAGCARRRMSSRRGPPAPPCLSAVRGRLAVGTPGDGEVGIPAVGVGRRTAGDGAAEVRDATCPCRATRFGLYCFFTLGRGLVVVEDRDADRDGQPLRGCRSRGRGRRSRSC